MSTLPVLAMAKPTSRRELLVSGIVGRMGDFGVKFEAPGPGRWRLDQGHAERPVRRVGWDYWSGVAVGSEAAFSSIGVGTRAIRIVYVHGWPYVQFELVDGGDTAELVRRDDRAREVVEHHAWRDIVDDWFERGRAEFVERCLGLQRRIDSWGGEVVACGQLVREAESLAEDGMAKHFELLAGNIGVGLYLHGYEHGQERADVLASLAGASPGSSEPARLAAAVAEAVGDSAGELAELSDVAVHGPRAVEALDAYIELFGSRSLDGTVEGPTFAEAPELVVRSIRAAAGRRPPSSSESEPVPADIGRSYALRDDNVGITCNWPAGLLRRAVELAGSALHAVGVLADAEHAFHLPAVELADACEKPNARLLHTAEMAATRFHAASKVKPPVMLDGAPLPRVKLALPAYVDLASAAFMTYSDPIASIESETGADLRGTGVGTRTIRGRARVAPDALEAAMDLEPDEILVTGVTDSGFNALLPMVAGLVTEQGGAMSHAALMARELDIPSIIGLRNALGRIPQGALIELDPANDIVHIIDETA